MSRTPNPTPRPSPRRRRTPPDWRPGFLAALEATGSVSAALSAAGVGRSTAYDARAADPAFAAAWAEALERAGDLLEAEARRRAVAGLKRPVLYQGRQATAWVDAEGEYVPAPEDCGENPAEMRARGCRQVALCEHHYSDALLTLLLRAAKPREYGDLKRVQLGGDPENPAPVRVEVDVFERIRQLLPDDREASGAGPGE